MIYSKTDRMIETERLRLRLFKKSDAKEIALMCNNYNVYKSTLSLPNPYTIECALSWIESHEENFKENSKYEFAITDKVTGQLYGAIGISNQKQFKHGEMGYWIAEANWGNGYASEAAKAVIEFVFKEKDFHRVYARHFASNPASGKVMKNCRMLYEGTMKDHIVKNGRFEDIVLYGIINSRK
ncbi:GNAT family N-acetyltransferase [Gottfriedia sp. NPDC056225]|uniref:GNAT family N-acetyltransferase n=1 Tax=Gottfriedia sp. NPDC056225 TaxID=3345751 RepID=UPI0035D930EF